MRIRWTLAAAEDLEHIRDYLAEHHPEFAQTTVLEIYDTIRSLKRSPGAGAQDAKRILEN
jgi:plasmid stabilization system protein ParE